MRPVPSNSTAARAAVHCTLQPCHSSPAAAIPPLHRAARRARMASATAFLPRIVALGRGAAQTQLRGVLQQCNVSKPFVVTDKNLEALTRSVLDGADVNGEIYADEVDEPTSDSVDAMAAALSSSGADGVLAIGGGSPLDAAKLAVVLSENGGNCRDYKAPVLTDTPPSSRWSPCRRRPAPGQKSQGTPSSPIQKRAVARRCSLRTARDVRDGDATSD